MKTKPTPTTFRTERYDPYAARWRHDDLEVKGLDEKSAHDIARNATRNSTVKRRVVNERSNSVVAVYVNGKKR